MLEENLFAQHLTTLRVFSGLMPPEDLFDSDKKDKPSRVEQLKKTAMKCLLYPPDLFAFTSAILGTTGAYYLIVSPPNNGSADDIGHSWEPSAIYDPKTGKNITFKDDSKKWKNWADAVAHLGVGWRKFLKDKFKDYESELNNTSMTAEEILKKTGSTGSNDNPFPEEIYTMMDIFIQGCDEKDINHLHCHEMDFNSLGKKRLWNAFVCLVTLHAVADEACIGWGIREKIEIPDYKLYDDGKSRVQEFAENLLKTKGTLSTIHPDRCRVLPKRHTPNVGMTLRNLSSSLAFTRSSVNVKWRKSVPTYLTEVVAKENSDEENNPGGGRNIPSLNILLIPCPLKINTRDFKSIKDAEIPRNNRRESFFEYNPVKEHPRWTISNNQRYTREDTGFKDWLTDLIKKAYMETERIDLIVMPETALSYDARHITQLEQAIQSFDISGYIVGVSKKRSGSKKRFNRNFVLSRMHKYRGEIDKINDSEELKKRHQEQNPSEHWYETFPKLTEEDIDSDDSDEVQHKHHRWNLNTSQIIQYQLGGVFQTNKSWWEGTKIPQRKVTFINIGDNVTICPLICEDLARQEPISDLIRAVGPSLVISLLMDGPQTADRWSASYAGILADDPRSSMLTLTCAGLVDMWKSNYKTNVPRIVAYWKDNLSYRQEIELEKGKDAIILYLNIENRKETTASGREEHFGTPYLTYGGTTQIAVD